jgi:hypothetical protein
MRKSGMCWHVHDDVLIKFCYDYDKRTKYIKVNKPPNEISTRLRLFKRVKGKLPAEVKKSEAACEKATVAYNKARTAYEKAEAACEKAIKDNMPAIKKLHAEECGCKEWDGKKIVFPD